MPLAESLAGGRYVFAYSTVQYVHSAALCMAGGRYAVELYYVCGSSKIRFLGSRICKAQGCECRTSSHFINCKCAGSMNSESANSWVRQFINVF